jgi:cytochrome b561
MIKNTSKHYGIIAMALHTIMGVGIFFMFGLGLYMVELTYYDAWYRGSLDLHKSLGIILLSLWLMRVVWRWFNTQPDITGTSFEKKAAHLMHNALYLMMVILMVTGYLISTADGRAISVFGLIDIPALSFAIDKQEDIAGSIHWALAWTLISMIALHALAAIKHQFIEKDGTMTKMFRLSKPLE